MHHTPSGASPSMPDISFSASQVVDRQSDRDLPHPRLRGPYAVRRLPKQPGVGVLNDLLGEVLAFHNPRDDTRGVTFPKAD